MPDLSYRLKTPEDDQWLVDTRNLISNHLPPSSVQSFRHWERVDRAAEKSHTERYLVERDGSRVGQFVVEKMWWTEKAGGFFCGLSVHPELWGQGIGSWIYEQLLARLGELKAERAYSNVRNDRPVAQSFVSKRGFEKTGHADRWSRLEVQTANLEGYLGVEDRLRDEGLVIRTLADIDASEDFLRKLHAAQDEAVADIPMSERFTGSPFEQFLEEIRDPALTPERSWIAMDGDEPVGVAFLPVESPGSAFNGFTGTRRAYRGKGVARALKLKTLEWARANGIEYIYTANDVNNTRMLSINNSLGYQELPISEEILKRLDGE